MNDWATFHAKTGPEHVSANRATTAPPMNDLSHPLPSTTATKVADVYAFVSPIVHTVGVAEL